jgi:hypothetical protein
LIVNGPAPTVISTGDQLVPALGLNARQLAGFVVCVGCVALHE